MPRLSQVIRGPDTLDRWSFSLSAGSRALEGVQEKTDTQSGDCVFQRVPEGKPHRLIGGVDAVADVETQ